VVQGIPRMAYDRIELAVLLKDSALPALFTVVE
jgi:hypothetical protein